jgi:curved DNA-binding protein CbpA
LTDPFTILGVDETAGDEEIKRRYLAMVRVYPPDLEPQRFQSYRAAYESLRDNRKRLEATLLAVNDGALTRLKLSCLPTVLPPQGRASRANVKALLIEGIEKAATRSASQRR